MPSRIPPCGGARFPSVLEDAVAAVALTVIVTSSVTVAVAIFATGALLAQRKWEI